MKLKNKIVLLLMCFVLCFGLTSCGDYENADKTIKSIYGGYFIQIEQWNSSEDNCRIVYAKDTKVKYLICSEPNRLAITPLYNADGSLQIYEEGE